MQVYAQMELRDNRLPLSATPGYARRIESLGYDGLHVSETLHDPFAMALLAAEHTERITIRTAIALAFVRSPTATAYAAWDLARMSGGRFQLGLGTQIKQNIEGRYGVPWREPVERMREYVEALGALFASFGTGEPLRYEGEHYRLTRMQPYFNPGPDPSITPPPIWLGGVNEGICELTGSHAEGFITHPTNSDRRYLDEICFPSIERGATRAGRTLQDVEFVVCADMATGATDAVVAAERERLRRMFAFLYSTPPYRRALELYGWGEVAEPLRRLIRADRWDELHHLVTDDMLETLFVICRYEELPRLLLERYAGVAAGVTVSPPADRAHDEQFREVIRALQAG